MRGQPLVKLSIKHDGIEYKVPVLGVNVGIEGLALTPDICWEEVMFVPTGKWSITHIGSGLRVAHGPTKAAVLRLVPVLRGHDWTRTEEELLEDRRTVRVGRMVDDLREFADFRKRGNRERFCEKAVELTGSELWALGLLGGSFGAEHH